MQNEDLSNKLEKKGIQGWLLLLVVVLTIGSPFANGIRLVSTYNLYVAATRISDSPMPNHFILFSVLTIAIIGFGVYVGVSLNKLKPYSVGLAKLYFVIHFFLGLFSFVRSLNPYFLNNQSLEEDGIAAMIGSSVWFLYLLNSRRVANTFPASRKIEVPVVKVNQTTSSLSSKPESTPTVTNSESSTTTKHRGRLLQNHRILAAYLISLMIAFLFVPWKQEHFLQVREGVISGTKSLGYSFFWAPPTASSALGTVSLDLTRILMEIVLLTLLFLTIFVLSRKKA